MKTFNAICHLHPKNIIQNHSKRSPRWWEVLQGRVHTVWWPLYEVLEQSKEWKRMWKVVASGSGHKGTSWGGVNILYFDSVTRAYNLSKLHECSFSIWTFYYTCILDKNEIFKKYPILCNYVQIEVFRRNCIHFSCLLGNA